MFFWAETGSQGLRESKVTMVAMEVARIVELMPTFVRFVRCRTSISAICLALALEVPVL